MIIEQEKKSDYIDVKIPRITFQNTSINGFLVFVLVVFTFLIGMLTNKVLVLQKEMKDKASQPVAQAAVPQAVPTEDTSPKKVSVDNDPVLGQPDAKITMIEFSDYECPFCKRYFDDTYSQIKKAYVDTGKIKIVYRDLPLSFHQNAHKEAEAAECVREQSDDSVYFKFHDIVFTRTTSNGTGLALDQLPVIANELGLDGQKLQACLDSGKYKAEVDKDIADATAVGANGTPTFFVGKSTSNGVILGTRLVGAQPFSAFQTLIDQQLKN
ncbi:MAG TPA: thioredoxin domain-containing protein [Candidatus Saccharimonadales bacterium]|nr:thioredoxin domain-containing protein [Candidatus Saccharimonadales bacterium]